MSPKPLSYILAWISILFINELGFSQISISGPSCGVTGSTSYFYAVNSNGNFEGVSGMQWCVSGGTILQAYGTSVTGNSTCQTGTNVTSIIVQWNSSSGSVTLYTPIGNAPGFNLPIAGALQPGTISNTSQTIPYNSNPVAISCSVATDGHCSPSYQYQWESSPDNLNWGLVPGQTLQNLPLTQNLIQTTYFRRRVQEVNTFTFKYSNVATVFVDPPFTSPIIAPSSQDIFAGELPQSTSLTSSPTGGNCNGNYSYIWQSSSDGVNFSNTGTTGNVQFNPGAIATTTYYRLAVVCGSDTAFSNVIVIRVYQHLSTPSISPSSLTITYNTFPTFTAGNPAGGKCGGIYSYSWEQSTDNVNFLIIPDVTAQNYFPGNLTTTTYFKRIVTCDQETVSSTVTVNVNAQLLTGAIYPENISIPANVAPGILTVDRAVGGTCANFSYQWQIGSDGVNFADIPGATALQYQPQTQTTSMYYRVKITCGTDIAYSSLAAITVLAGQTLYNYVQTRDYLKPQVSTEAQAVSLSNATDVRQATQYLDKLGRPSQFIAKEASLETGGSTVDLVAFNTYDRFGRERISILPFSANNAGGNASLNDGNFKQNPLQQQLVFYNLQLSGQSESFFFSKNNFEYSPLNRVQKTSAPGISWTGNDIGVSTEFLANNSLDQVRIWKIASNSLSYSNEDPATNIPVTTSVYSLETLYKLVTKDEKGNAVVEFKDRKGQLILKKVQQGAIAPDYSGTNGFLLTYYVYDDFGRLRFVIPPLAVEKLLGNSWQFPVNVIQELCFRYEYDSRDRMTAKKVPGAGWIYMIYDKRDRLVFTQDANLRKPGVPQKWLVTLYDQFNRAKATGMVDYSGTPANLQTYVDQNTGAGSTTTVHESGGVNSNLVINQRVAGVTEYRATQSITFEPEFTSEVNAEFTAEIDPNLQGASESIDVVDNPIPSSSNFVALTLNYFDDYSWTTKTYNTSNNYLLDHGSNLYPVALPASASNATLGLSTGMKVRVLENPDNFSADPMLASVIFYDDQVRVIQTQTENYKGMTDVVTRLFDFSGKLLTIYSVQNNPAAGASGLIKIKTNMEYDQLGRVKQIFKKINDDPAKLIVSNEYNKLGNLKKKILGNGNLEDLNYEYNIRGWLLGVNRDFVTDQANRKFGFELGYDKPNTVLAGASYANPQLNGNISGTIWKSIGDGEKRKYDFSYDALNRLVSADFNQYTNSSFNKSAQIDFSLNNLTYDANGNILTMMQKGLKVTSSNWIDQLTYDYITNSNKLAKVTDGVSDPQTKLGDFKDGNNGSADDYSYDINGNLIADQNKAINTINYNHLNLPNTITIPGKGTIKYVYDALGNKIKKTVTESGQSVKTNLYLGAVFYENEILQFVSHEEGRARYTAAVGERLLKWTLITS